MCGLPGPRVPSARDALYHVTNEDTTPKSTRKRAGSRGLSPRQHPFPGFKSLAPLKAAQLMLTTSRFQAKQGVMWPQG